MKKTGKNKPSLITEEIRLRRFWNVNIEAAQESDGRWSWESIPLRPGTTRVDQVITALVEYKYPGDKITGILQSYISSPDDMSVRWEYEALQAWKNEATKIAEKVIEAINEREGELQDENFII